MSEETNSTPPEEQEEINPNSLKAFDTLRNFMEEDDWHPNQLEGKYIFSTGFSGENGRFACYAQIRMELEQFLFYCVAPVKVPEEKRMEAAAFITRANYGMRIGNFEMDFNDGEVRYTSALDFENAELTEEWLKHAMYPAVQTMDRYMPGLMGVMYGEKSAEEAIEEIEG